MAINILWLCCMLKGGWDPDPFKGAPPISFTMMLHAIMAVVVAANLKAVCRSERLKGYRSFLVVNVSLPSDVKNDNL